MPELPMVSLISHPSKIILNVILSRLNPQIEKIVAEEKAGFGAERNTTEQILSQQFFCVEHLQYQRELYHLLIKFTEVFDWVEHAAL